LIVRFYQRGSRASHASAGTATVEMPVCSSVRHTLVLKIDKTYMYFKAYIGDSHNIVARYRLLKIFIHQQW